METKHGDPQSNTMQRVRNFGIFNLNGLSPSNPSPQSSGNPTKEEVGKKEPEETKKARPGKST